MMQVQAAQLMVEDWNSGAIDPGRWNVVLGPGSRFEAIDIGAGDYALGMSVDAGWRNWESSMMSHPAFSRGGNLRVTFKVWGRDEGFPAGFTLCGTWHSSYFLQASPITIEAALWLFWPNFSFDENRVYGARALPDTETFSVGLAKARSKDSALTIRVSLGDATGAMFEWHDGMQWHTSVDTRGQPVDGDPYVPGNSNLNDEFGNPRAAGMNIGHAPTARIGFSPFSKNWLMIDDLVVENDAPTPDAVVDLGNQAAEAAKKRNLKGEPKPWTHLNYRNDPRNFQFTIISDLSGGLRPEAFKDAVRKLNLIQPEFVMSVGDLIEGMTLSESFTHRQLDEFDEWVEQLEMPFYYVPGNHDLGNKEEYKVWRERYGTDYYDFVYQDVLFLCLNSNDPYVSARFSRQQIDWVAQELKKHRDVRWTLVFMHDPMWVYNWKTGWEEIEALLQDREYTVFAGHFHNYIKFDRLGRRYIVLASTGGSSTLAGPKAGAQFDHIAWVTMTDQGPLIVNYMLDGIYDENVVIEEEAQDILESKRVNMEKASKFYGTFSDPNFLWGDHQDLEFPIEK